MRFSSLDKSMLSDNRVTRVIEREKRNDSMRTIPHGDQSMRRLKKKNAAMISLFCYKSCSRASVHLKPILKNIVEFLQRQSWREQKKINCPCIYLATIVTGANSCKIGHSAPGTSLYSLCFFSTLLRARIKKMEKRRRREKIKCVDQFNIKVENRLCSGMILHRSVTSFFISYFELIINLITRSSRLV